MERLGFESVKSIRVKHKGKRKAGCFTIHLMWMPTTENAKPPTGMKRNLWKGCTFANITYSIMENIGVEN